MTGAPISDPGSRDSFRQLTTSARLLLCGGLLLLLGGLVAGEVFALLISHRLNADLRAAWLGVLELSGRREVDAIAARFEHIHYLATQRGHVMSIHSHAGPYGLLATALALTKTRLGALGRYDLPAAILIVAGGLIQSAGFVVPNHETIAWLSFSNTGVVMLLIGIGCYVPGLMPAAAQYRALPGPEDAGGMLLRAGATLAFAGLLFGLFLAWRHVFFEEPALHLALKELMGAIRRGDTEVAKAIYATYKSTQIRMAITAASHSHAVAFGLTMILAALLAGHLRLTSLWRNTAYTLIAAGGFLLPVFVYLAPRFGYIYALCADAAGALVILGLLITLIGLIPERAQQ